MIKVKVIIFLSFIFLILFGMGEAGIEVVKAQDIDDFLIFENFNDQQYSTPLTFYNKNSCGSGYDMCMVYDSDNSHGESGYSLLFDHSQGFLGGIGVLDNFSEYIQQGIYIRYYVKFDINYRFPDEMDGTFWNIKLHKISGDNGANLEWGWSSRNSICYGWTHADGVYPMMNCGYHNQDIKENVWYKIETYLSYVPGASTLHLQFNDIDILWTGAGVLNSVGD